MKVSTSVLIDAPKEKVWKVVTDFSNVENVIQAIDKIEVLEKPKKGLVGFKWKEARTMFGKQATEVMWITEAKENGFYQTRAESHGSVYISEVRVEDEGGATRLIQSFDGQAVSMGVKVMSALMGWMMKGSVRKAFDKDLADIKAFVEGQS